jgi:hypothetical protein
MRRPSSRTSPVLLVLGGIFAVATIAWGCYQLVSLIAHERTRSEVSFPAGVTRLQIDTDAGHIELRGTDGDTIRGERVIDRGIGEPRFSERVDGDTLVIRADCPWWSNHNCGVEYVLDVPASVAVDASSSGSGIETFGLFGPQTLDSSGGGITVVDPAGELDIDSSGGGITVRGARSPQVVADSSGGGVRVGFAAPPASVDVESSGGGVTIELPPGPVAYAVDAESSGGGRRVDVKTDPDSASRIRARSSGGGVTVRYRTEP